MQRLRARPHLAQRVDACDLRNEVRDDGHGVDEAHQGAGSLGGDSPDADERHPGGSGHRLRHPDTLDADDRVGVALRRRLEHRTERDVVGPGGQGGGQLLARVRRHTDAKARGDPADAIDRHVRLPHVDDVAPRHDGEVRTVVGDERHAQRVTHRGELTQQREHLARRHLLRANLQRGRAHAQHGARERDRIEATCRKRAQIEDGVETAHRCTAT